MGKNGFGAVVFLSVMLSFAAVAAWGGSLAYHAKDDLGRISRQGNGAVVAAKMLFGKFSVTEKTVVRASAAD